MATLIVTGDVNLMNVDDPAVPFARVRDAFHAADMVFSNLECCLYRRQAATRFTTKDSSPIRRSVARRCGSPASAPWARENVNYGEAAILGSIAQLDGLGMPHTGAGANLAAAHAAVMCNAAGCGSGCCSAVRSIGRPTTRPGRTTRASR